MGLGRDRGAAPSTSGTSPSTTCTTTPTPPSGSTSSSSTPASWPPTSTSAAASSRAGAPVCAPLPSPPLPPPAPRRGCLTNPHVGSSRGIGGWSTTGVRVAMRRYSMDRSSRGVVGVLLGTTPGGWTTVFLSWPSARPPAPPLSVRDDEHVGLWVRARDPRRQHGGGDHLRRRQERDPRPRPGPQLHQRPRRRRKPPPRPPPLLPKLSVCMVIFRPGRFPCILGEVAPWQGSPTCFVPIGVVSANSPMSEWTGRENRCHFEGRTEEVAANGRGTHTQDNPVPSAAPAFLARPAPRRPAGAAAAGPQHGDHGAVDRGAGLGGGQLRAPGGHQLGPQHTHAAAPTGARGR